MELLFGIGFFQEWSPLRLFMVTATLWGVQPSQVLGALGLRRHSTLSAHELVVSCRPLGWCRSELPVGLWDPYACLCCVWLWFSLWQASTLDCSVENQLSVPYIWPDGLELEVHFGESPSQPQATEPHIGHQKLNKAW